MARAHPADQTRREGPDRFVGPVRTCVGCRRRRSAVELVRTVLGGDGDLVVDRAAGGRGAWVCREAGSDRARATCIDQGERRGAFARALRAPVGRAAVDALRATAAKHARIDDGAAVDAAPSGRD